MLTVNVHSYKGFSEADLKVAKRGISLLEVILNSNRFKDAVLAAKFTETRGMTNQEIYDAMMSGNCLFTNEKDEKIDVKLVLTSSLRLKFSRVIGWCYPDVDYTIYMNRKYFGAPINFAENLTHEALGHLLGFYHQHVWASSVPYQIGAIVRQVARELRVA